MNLATLFRAVTLVGPCTLAVISMPTNAPPAPSTLGQNRASFLNAPLSYSPFPTANGDLALMNMDPFAQFPPPETTPGNALDRNPDIGTRILVPARQREQQRLDFGMEYLAHFHMSIMSNKRPLMVFSGDSTTEAVTGPMFAGYRIHEVAQRIARRRGYVVRSHNAGHAGKQTSDWLDSYLAEDLNMNPDVYVMRWGLNDPYSNTPLSQTLSNFRTALERIRSTHPVGAMSLVLMLPNSITNPEMRRDITFVESLREPLMELAREFHCAFVDTAGLALDSGPAAVNVWMDSPNGGRGGLHPLRVMNVWIANHLAGLLFPEGLLP